MPSTYDDRWLYLTDAEADEIKTALAASLCLDPLDYDGCLKLGVWRRLDAGERTLPIAAARVIGASNEGDATSRTAPAAVVTLLREEEVERVIAEMAMLRISAIVGLSNPSPDEPLAAAGLELAVLMGRRRFVGSSVIALIDRGRLLLRSAATI